MDSSENTKKNLRYPISKQPSESKISPAMKLAQIILFVLTVFFTPVATFSPIAKPGCHDTCGEIKIPYPFGTTKDCYLESNFLVTCNYSFDPPKLFLQDSSVNITKISLEGQLNILKFVARACYSQSTAESEFRLSKFTINSTINKFIAVGCDTYGFARGIRYISGKTLRQTIGCISMCGDRDDVINGSCSGGGCCQTSIPNGMTRMELAAGSYYNHSYVEAFSPCSFAFVVEEGKFNFSLDSLTNLRSVDKLPMVLDWGIGDENQACEKAIKASTTYACQNNTYCISGKGNYTGYRCFCKEGYEGNPYLPNIGCHGTYIFDKGFFFFFLAYHCYFTLGNQVLAHHCPFKLVKVYPLENYINICIHKE